MLWTEYSRAALFTFHFIHIFDEWWFSLFSMNEKRKSYCINRIWWICFSPSLPASAFYFTLLLLTRHRILNFIQPKTKQWTLSFAERHSCSNWMRDTISFFHIFSNLNYEFTISAKWVSFGVPKKNIFRWQGSLKILIYCTEFICTSERNFNPFNFVLQSDRHHLWFTFFISGNCFWPLSVHV